LTIGNTKYIFQTSDEVTSALPGNSIYITDTHVYELHKDLFTNKPTIVIPPGEAHKTQDTISYVTEQLLRRGAHRKTTLVGVGGGIVTDIAGYAASIYMRGVPFCFIPTTLLGMVDAAIGGKNGINFGLQKNLLGTINQPDAIVFDTQFLKTLPDTEWSNGFAEIIKYACLFDTALFDELGRNNIHYYQQHDDALTDVIKTCVDWKTKVVADDEHENGNRKLLNFGHTAGHAIETLYQLSHGQAVTIGMMIACRIAEREQGAPTSIEKRLKELLHNYGLPSAIKFDVKQVMQVLTMDKKRNDAGIEYILLKDIGEACITLLSFGAIEEALVYIDNGSNY